MDEDTTLEQAIEILNSNPNGLFEYGENIKKGDNDAKQGNLFDLEER